MRLRPSILLSLFLLLAFAGVSVRAGTLDATISVTSLAPPRVHVEGTTDVGTRKWSFLNVYAGVMGLGERIDNFTLRDASGQEVPTRRLAPGEYEAAREAQRFSYDLRLDPPSRTVDAAHVSWLTRERGLLLLGDMLPVPVKHARVRFVLPAGWAVSSSEVVNINQAYEVEEAEQAVFLVGSGLRIKSARSGAIDYTIATGGTWAFSDEDAQSTVRDILKDYEKVLGGTPRRRANVVVVPFPGSVAAQTWSAETRGGTVVLLSGQWPSKVAALARLDAVLSHELLHLWVPNGLSLDGEYDWFYEGFTLYMAVRSGVRRGQLTFQDYLDALGRAHDGYRSNRSSQEISLIDASRRRWTLASPSIIYEKGMLVAFLYDLNLLQRTGGRNSLEDVYRALIRKHGARGTREDGNRAVLNMLGSTGGMQDFALRYVEKPSALDLSAELAPFGLRMSPGVGRTRIVVADSLSRGQGELLSKLGYNEKANSYVRSRARD